MVTPAIVDFESSPCFQLRAPAGTDEWERYFDLRWRVLRAPWNQPRGSERDERDSDSSHLALWDPHGVPLAVGRLHLNSPVEAQVRYMAVEPKAAGRGLGSQILAGLEARADEFGARRIVLNARELVRRFYERHGYTVIGPAATLFGEVPHVRMFKEISKT